MPSFSDSQRFSHLSVEERDRLESLAKLDEWPDGGEVLSASHPAEWLWLLADGAVELSLPAADAGAPLVVATLSVGDVFGELEGDDEMPSGLQHVARGRVVAHAIAKSPLRHELHVHRELATKLLFVYGRAISEKVRMADDTAAGIAAHIRACGAGQPVPIGRRANPHLAEDEASWLEMLGHKLEFAEGRSIVSEGDNSRAFFVIDSGEVEVRKRVGVGAHEADYIVAVLGRRDLFGHMAFIDGGPRSASVVAVDGPAVCTRIDAAALQEALRLNFTVAFKFLGTMRSVLGRMFGDTVRWIAQMRTVAAELEGSGRDRLRIGSSNGR